MRLPKNPLVILVMTVSIIVFGIVVGYIPGLSIFVKIGIGTTCGILAAKVLFSIVPPIKKDGGNRQ